MRRYEVDSIRSIALLLLIAYHIVISFILETIEISFIVNPEFPSSLEFWMSDLNSDLIINILDLIASVNLIIEF